MGRQICRLVFAAFFLISLEGADLLENARRSLDLMDYAQAVQLFQRALRKNPDLNQAREGMAFCLFRMGRMEAALEILNESAARDGERPAPWILATWIHHRAEQEEEAENAALRCLQWYGALSPPEYNPYVNAAIMKDIITGFHKRLADVYPNLGMSLFYLGFREKQRENFGLAQSLTDKALQLGYSRSECLIQLMDIQIRRENWDEALRLALDNLQGTNRQPEILTLMGYIYFQLEENRRAVHCFKEALKNRPYLEDGLKNLAAVSMYMGDTAEVKRVLKRLRRLRPFDLDVQRIGSFLQGESGINTVMKTGEGGRRPRLWKELSESVSLKWRHRFTFDLAEARKLTNQSALVLIKTGRTDDAIRFLNEFLELDDRSPEIHYNLAQFFNFRSDIKRTLIHAGKAVELKPDFKDALDLIGNVFFTLGDYESSRDYYSRVLEIDPEDAMGLYNLGCVFSALEDYPEAEKYWLEAAAREQQKREEASGENKSDDPLAVSLVVIGRKVGVRAHKSLGQLFAEHGRTLEAVEQYLAAERLDPGDPSIHFELGRLYVNLNNLKEARRHLEKCLYLGGTMESEVRRLLESIGRKKK